MNKMRYCLEIDTDTVYSRRDVKTNTINNYYDSLKELDDVTSNFDRETIAIHLWKNKVVMFYGEIRDIRIRVIEDDELREELPVVYEDDVMLKSKNEKFNLKDFCIDCYVSKLLYSKNDLDDFLLSIMNDEQLKRWADKIYIMMKNRNMDYAEIEMTLRGLLDIYLNDYLLLRKTYFELKKDWLGDTHGKMYNPYEITKGR